MRSCEELEWMLNLYLDDMLPSEEEPALKAHLAECPACRERLEQLRAMQQAVAGLDEPVPEELHQRILEHVVQYAEGQPKQASAAPLRPHRWIRALAAVAACAALCIAAVRLVPWMTAGRMFEADAMSGAQMQGAADQLIVENTAADGAAAAPESREEPSKETAPVPDAAEEALKDFQDSEKIAVDMPPLLGQSSTDAAEKSIGRWLLAQGARAEAPECLTQTTVYEGELEGEAVSYVEIAVFAQDYWLEQLAACGFTVTELEGESLSADGQYIRLYFSWTE